MRRLMLWLLPGFGLLGLLLLGWDRTPYRGVGSSGEGQPLLIVFGSEINGYLTPCGCSKPMVGGIPRRATLLKQLAKSYRLLKLENGDLTKASGRQDELKAETLIEMLNLMGYDALNLGEYDFKLGLAYLQALQQRFQGKMLCGNVVDSAGKPLFDAFTLLDTSHNGRTVQVLVVGLLSERYADTIRQRNPDLQVLPALQRLDELREQLSTAGELRILLWHGSQQEAEQIAKQHPYFDLIVYAHAGDGPLPPKQVGKTRLVFSGTDAKFVGLAYLEHETNPALTLARIDHIRLTEDYKDDPDALQIKLGYLARVDAEGLLLQVARRPTLNGDTFAGSRACRPCHAEDYRIWERSKHAKAMQTLIDEKHDKDPECVICHVVGLEYEGGFVSMDKTPQLKDVGCESCHGPARKHVQDPLNHKLGKAGEASCMQCHVPAHSPNFDFPTYWQQIEHGQSLRDNR
ncbi:Cytochrome c-554 [bacterium HR15]|nr:Cytochrome c-554 [bacterium HR15]